MQSAFQTHAHVSVPPACPDCGDYGPACANCAQTTRDHPNYPVCQHCWTRGRMVVHPYNNGGLVHVEDSHDDDHGPDSDTEVLSVAPTGQRVGSRISQVPGQQQQFQPPQSERQYFIVNTRK